MNSPSESEGEAGPSSGRMNEKSDWTVEGKTAARRWSR